MTTQPNRVSSQSLASGASVREIADTVRTAGRRAADIADDALARLAAIAPLNAMVHVDADLARRTAASVDARIAQGDVLPLAGVPFVIKDNLDTVAMPTLGASPAVNGYRAAEDALAVRRLLDAGAVPLGKANMHELAFGITSGNRHFGAVGNPHDPRRIAGGSSGGTAAAVAAGIPFGLGTDTGGSVRIPAAFCGVYGLRPSAQRYSPHGVLSLSPTRDTVGPIGHDIDDLLLLDTVLTRDDSPAAAPEWPRLRIGVPGAPYFDALDPGVAACIERALASFAAAGATLVPLPAMPLHEANEACSFPIVAFEANRYWRNFAAERLGIPFDVFVERIASDDVRDIFRSFVAAPVEAGAYAEGIACRQRLVRWYDDAFGMPVDCIAMPTVPGEPPALDEVASMTAAQGGALFERVVRQTSPATLAGVPSVSIPAGRSAQTGLPVGLMLEGPWGSDRRLLAIARRIDARLRADATAA
ncbi:indole acetimide hydrolase [Burkholderia stabilis]|uniref:indoleacetamide hydrolase n=1 Tax=Burkholderia stabilis TaxID=95485 RepID=UPI0008520344|nr:indoleacetamide hydrolase [Burkholderia stabilis]AOR72149.1 indole acetimide hydrolase [Burkholderia stabilis]HDR9488889.1 indoleacetamide hydrolase [Burkholderia stabilis]HDR9521148.1 indoleacetamide hydrolase [Burkholderia stabilis]HDR9528899.1 indoleacetamide hydrolase [Burkholderia stabilis]HDR9536895.1 indoleacetamide hydrolase [Burkholderia stabilis]